MIETQEFRLSDRPVKPPGHVPFYRKFAKQIVFSVIGSMIAGMIINATSLVVVVRYCAAGVIRVLGDPFAGGRGVWHQLEGKASEAAKNAPSGGGLSLNPLRPSPEQMETKARLKEEDRDRKQEEQRNKLIARAEAVGLAYGDDWTLQDFQVKVPIAEEKAREAEERRPLLAQAKELKMLVDEEWDNKMLKMEIAEEKAFQRADADYQEQLRRYQEAVRQREELIAHGPNARCPNRQCGHQLRFGPNRKSGKYVCPKCEKHFTVTQAKACFTPPPMPREPFPPQRKAPGFFKRTFG